MISPMPKQYRKLHLTPKSTGSDNGKQNKIRRKRYSSNQSMSGQSHHDERKDSEEQINRVNRRRSCAELISYKDEYYKLQNKNSLLENSILDLKSFEILQFLQIDNNEHY